ncbi:tetratricopeptide repeat-containing sensor histidine kinase [Tenacibaculum ovolyticum]|uniref:tetratricopeptide repeat-containing sensor histidine kinase n=1 Tax=Tenacibaculum ovolyticum TaxID=104270 RepID=UPI001EEE2BE7|nr:tetratricopeptide repeat-containing sensor histidine kinase [Tenacibaculum ovolyticum]
MRKPILFIFMTFLATKVAFTQNNNLNKNTINELNISRFKLIKSLYNNKEYSLSLKKALVLVNSCKQNNINDISILTNDLIGDIFKENRNYQKSLAYYKESLKLHINYKKPLDKKISVFFKSKKDSSYINLLFKIGSSFHNLNKNDSAKYYYDKIINFNTINNHQKLIKAKAFNNLSNLYYYTKENDFVLAEKYALKAIEIKRKTGSKASEAASIASLANVYLEQKMYEKSRQYYLKAISLIEKNDDIKSLKFKEVFYENISWAMYNQKKYQAYNYLDKSFNIRDSIREAEIKDILMKIENQHEENLEQQKTILIKKKVELEKVQQAKTSILFGALSLLVIIISGVIVYNYKLRQKNLQLKLSENNLLQQQSIEKLKSDAHTKILNATIDGKESERKQIAETLHDNVSALLSSANMHLSATKKQFKDNAPLEIEKTQAIILEASQKVRDLSHNLISSILLKFGLEYALKDAMKKYSNSQLEFVVSAHNINRYNQEFEIKIFNIIQELANNILKHSKANYAQITIKQEKNQLTILVNDDGVGFSTSSSSINDGIGLNQIEARLKMMEGKFSINSKKNKGTKISITIPIQEQKPFKLSSVS